MGFDLTTGLIVVAAIALLYLAFFFGGRKIFKKPPPDEGINESRELSEHDPGHVGRNEPSDADNRQTAI